MNIFGKLIGGCLGVCLIPFLLIASVAIYAWFSIVACDVVVDPVLSYWGITTPLSQISFWMWCGIFLTILGVRRMFMPEISESNKKDNQEAFNMAFQKLVNILVLIISLYILNWMY